MNTPGFIKSATAALLAPLALVLGRAIWSGHAELWPLLPMNWLYMAAPQLLVVAVAASYPPYRRAAWLPLSLLTTLLFAVQAWVLWWVPARESGLAWILYFPTALVVVVLSTLAQKVARRWQRAPR